MSRLTQGEYYIQRGGLEQNLWNSSKREPTTTFS